MKDYPDWIKKDGTTSQNKNYKDTQKKMGKCCVEWNLVLEDGQIRWKASLEEAPKKEKTNKDNRKML